MITVLNESYDPFKKDLKKASNGQYTDGRGNRYDVSKATSELINHNGYTFQYDYDNALLKWIIKDNGEEEIDAIGLSIGSWLDSPEYWMDRFIEEIKEETEGWM